MPSDRSPFTLRAALRRQAVLVLALGGLVAAVALGAAGRAPLAGLLLAGMLALLAILRAVLPTAAVGGLAVRGRAVDVTVLAVLAIGLAVLSRAPNL